MTVLATGAGLFGLAYIGLAVIGPAPAVLLTCFVAVGIAIGCVETAEHTAIAVHAPAEMRGPAIGVLAAEQAFGNLAASSIAGVVWTVVSPTVALVFAAALTIAAVFAFIPGAAPVMTQPAGDCH